MDPLSYGLPMTGVMNMWLLTCETESWAPRLEEMS